MYYPCDSGEDVFVAADEAGVVLVYFFICDGSLRCVKRVEGLWWECAAGSGRGSGSVASRELLGGKNRDRVLKNAILTKDVLDRRRVVHVRIYLPKLSCVIMDRFCLSEAYVHVEVYRLCQHSKSIVPHPSSFFPLSPQNSPFSPL